MNAVIVRFKRRPGAATSRRLFVAWLSLLAAGCATLPDVDEQMAQAPQADVVVEGASGIVSQQTGERLIDEVTPAGSDEQLQKHLAFEQAINPDRPLVAGNRVTLLKDGPQTYAAMFAAIEAAKHHVNLETFLFDDGEVGQKFSSLLQKRARSGIRVSLIYDSVGTKAVPGSFFETMRSAGVHLLEFNPINPAAPRTRPWRINNRDHRKLLVVDGTVAFVGGINISETYSSSSSHGGSGSSGSSSGGSSGGAEPQEEGWRDTHLRIEGPVVAQFQTLYVDTWNRHAKDPIDQTDFFPELRPKGDELVRAVSSTYEDDESAVFSTLVSAIRHSESSVYLTIAYFAPDKQLMDALEDAARRHVDVRLILPSVTDSWAVFHVGRSHYEDLLEAGVRIYERQGAVTHSKTACIDGVWSTIGSTNLDWRSFLHNNEVNAVVLSRELGGAMKKLFAGDLAESKAIEHKQWRRRSLLERLQEMTARLGEYFL